MRLGEREVFPVALGGARWSLVDRPSIEPATSTLRAARRAGVQLVDTAPAYAPPGEPHHNERLIASVIGDQLRTNEMIVSTKVGHGRAPDGSLWIDGRPATLRNQCERSLRALNLDAIPLLSLHWPDPEVPISESVGTLEELRREGKVRYIGVCNVDLAQLDDAVSTAKISTVQNLLSAIDPSDEVLGLCRSYSIEFLGYSPFGGAEAGAIATDSRFLSVARRHGISPYQVAIRFLLDLGGVTPIVGAGRPSSIEDAVRGVHVNLTSVDRRTLSRVKPSKRA